MEMPFDLVADGEMLLAAACCASSKANLSTRSTPMRVMKVSWTANSRSVPANMRPPTLEYSPSVFSRTTKKSMSPGLRLASGQATPGISRTGRRLTYWSNSRRNGTSEPHSETWSGTFAGQPTAPKKIASWPPICCFPVLRHHAAVLLVVFDAGEVEPVELECEAVLLAPPPRARARPPAPPPCRCRRRE